ncbi:MAG: hypothetical protein WDN49_15760 [Acetobacteraceae bacterium]
MAKRASKLAMRRVATRARSSRVPRVVRQAAGPWLRGATLHDIPPALHRLGLGFRHAVRCYDACERIAVDELGLECNPNRIEVITSEQMLDVYTASACR